jgi:hypothetical protein
MSDWSTIDAAANLAMQQAFGDPNPVVYQAVRAGAASGDSVSITVIRHVRVHEESGGLANVEEISVNPSDLANFPQRGDWVTAWGSQFVVSTVRQPDPYGMVVLSLMLRTGQ